jgi:hypothetical protein
MLCKSNQPRGKEIPFASLPSQTSLLFMTQKFLVSEMCIAQICVEKNQAEIYSVRNAVTVSAYNFN